MRWGCSSSSRFGTTDSRGRSERPGLDFTQKAVGPARALLKGRKCRNDEWVCPGQTLTRDVSSGSMFNAWASRTCGSLQARCLAHGMSALSCSQGSVCPRDKLSQFPASQLRQAEKPLGAISIWADGLIGFCCLECHHGCCPSQAATPGWQGHELAIHKHLMGTNEMPSACHRGPAGVGVGARLAMVNRTCSKNGPVLCGGGLARRRPECRQWRPRGGESDRGGILPSGAI